MKGYMAVSSLTTSAAVLRDVIYARRSIRSFADRPVERELVSELLADALWAPSPHNSQPWRFTVLFERDDKSRLAGAMGERLAAELRADRASRRTPTEEAIERQQRRSEGRIGTAPVVILCSLVREGLVTFPDARRNELEFAMAVQSVGAVLQTLFLLAESRGLGSCWMAAPMYCPDVVRDVLGLPCEFEPQALALLGYPAVPGKVRPRRELAAMVDLR
jgi:F420 biosynthesis protein FbiB-like protein